MTALTAAWQEQRAQRGIHGMTEADWVAAFSRSSNSTRYTYAENEKAVLLPPPPRLFDNTGPTTVTGHDTDDDWGDDWGDGPLNPRPPRGWRWLLLLLVCGGLFGPLFVNACLPWPVPHLGGIIGYKSSVPFLWSSSPSAAKLDSWIRAEASVAWDRVLENIGPAAGAPDGVVIASPSTGGDDEPDYYVSAVGGCGMWRGGAKQG